MLSGNFVKYHRLVRDFDKREADGITPVLPLLKEFQELETFADFTAKLAEFELAGKPNFLPLVYHQTSWMPESMFYGPVLQALSCQIQPTMQKTILNAKSS